MLIIDAYALQFGTEYKLEVKVFNEASTQVAPGEEVIIFTTTETI